MKLLLLFLPLLMGMSSPSTYCFTWNPSTTRTDGSTLTQAEFNYRMQVNGKDYYEPVSGSASEKCFWYDTSDPVCVKLKTVDTEGRESKNWSNEACK